MFHLRNTFNPGRNSYTKNKRWKTIFYMTETPPKAVAAVLYSEKVDFKPKIIMRQCSSLHTG